MKLEEILDAFLIIGGTPSLNEKQKVLQKYKDNEVFRYILKFLFDKNITTGISTKKINQDKKIDVSEDFDDVIDVIEYLSKNNSGKIYDVCVVKKFINKQDKNHENTLLELFSKKLKLGITAKTINKAFKEEFISIHEVQRAELYEDNKDYLIGKEIACTIKLDGCRAWIYIENHKVKIVSREGKLVTGLTDIEKELSILDNMILDGELICKTGDTSLDRFRNTTAILRTKANYKSDINFEIYDIVNNDIYTDRRNKIEQLFKDNKFENIKNVKVLYKGIYDKDIVNKLLNEAKSNNEEGIMINVCDAKYQFKRTKDLLKVKVFKEIDLKVVNILEGEGEIKGKLGAVVVKYKGFDVKVGSGFTMDQRDELWRTKSIIGKIIRIKYFEESIDQDDNLSLRLPVFIDICDKKEESYF